MEINTKKCISLCCAGFFWLPLILTIYINGVGGENEIADLKNTYNCEYPKVDEVMEFAITP